MGGDSRNDCLGCIVLRLVAGRLPGPHSAAMNTSHYKQGGYSTPPTVVRDITRRPNVPLSPNDSISTSTRKNIYSIFTCLGYGYYSTIIFGD